MKERESWTQTVFKKYVNKSGGWTRCYSLFHQTSRSIDIPPPASCDALPGISGADDVVKKTAVVSEASAPVWRGDAGVPKNTSVLFIDQNREVFCASATNSHTLDSLVFHWVSVSCLSLNTYQHQLEPHENSKQVIFLMADVIDAWQRDSECFFVNVKQRDSSWLHDGSFSSQFSRLKASRRCGSTL